jgi:GntR family transcriptional regulator
LVDAVRDQLLTDFFIGHDRLEPGESLPGEVALSERYGVSRVTLRGALASLSEAGFISVRHGSGATVMPRTGVLLMGLDRLCSMETLARETGTTVATADLEFERMAADERLAERLEIEPGAPVTAVRRVKLYDGERVAYLIAWVPEQFYSLDELRQRFDGSVFDVFGDDPAFAVETVDCEITAVTVTSDLAARLDVPVGTAALRLDELMCDVDGRPIDCGVTWYLPEHFRFTLRRRRKYPDVTP